MAVLAGCTTGKDRTKVILPALLESRRAEFHNYVDSARGHINLFARENGWGDLVKEAFMDSVMVFNDKMQFNKTLLGLAGADPSTELPETYCAALESGVLIVMSPEYYAQVYPQGIEEQSYTKLLIHEIAHRLHIRILKGNEEGMGPIWFYEGFAIYVANQFSRSDLKLSKEEMIMVMQNPDRGNYLQYNFVFHYFANRIPLQELIENAKEKKFNDALIDMLN